MVDYDSIFFNTAAFIGGLFVLEYGADTFVDHTAKVASRLGISPTLIALVTAGAEWEELVVVIAAISQQHSSLALGNILGSSISNILGAFSLGLIFSPAPVVFDRSAKIYTGSLLALTTAFVIYLPFFQVFGRFGGVALITTFVVYFISIAYYIYKGIVSPPVNEDSDDDSDSDSESDSDTEDVHEKSKRPRLSRSSSSNDEEAVPEEMLPAFTNGHIPLKTLTSPHRYRHSVQSLRRQPSSLTSHVVRLILGFLALSLSGYLLSHSISSLASAFSISDSVVGITLLSFATTLPEKLVAVIGGAKKQSGIVVANTAGSNVFLLTLCAGVLMLTGDLGALTGEVKAFDVFALWGSSLLLFVIVFMGGRCWMGWGLMGLYLGFIVVEFVFYGRFDSD